MDAARTDQSRLLTEAERAVIARFLVPDFEGVEALRDQLPGLRASVGWCCCGCSSIELIAVRTAAQLSLSSSPVPVRADVMDAAGNPAGGLLLFVNGGYLSDLEIYSFGDPLALPGVDVIRWGAPNA